MTTLSDYLLKDRCVEYAESILIELDSTASVSYPSSHKVMLHLVLDGSAFVRLEEADQPTELMAGEYAVLFYGKAHSIHGGRNPSKKLSHVVDKYESGDEPGFLKIGKEGKCSVRLVSSALSLVRAMPTFAAYPLPDLLPFKAEGGGIYSGRALLTDMAQVTAACQGPGANAFLSALANLHLFQSIRHTHAQFRQMYPVKLGAPIANTITATLRIMHTHPEKQWTVEALAQEVGLSRSSFAAKFRAHVGLGPMQYLTGIRMKYVADLLRNTKEVPLWDVSRRVGYKSESSFARAFKLHFGVSPRAFSKRSDDR